MIRTSSLLVLVLTGCASDRSRENAVGWYTPADDYDVQETIEFTTTPYQVQGDSPIVDIPHPGDFETWFATDDDLPNGNCSDWSTRSELPITVSGIVTAHPRWYYKASGCRPEDDRNIDSDEKFYGSYFLEDETGGFFILGDTKVAHFDMGDRITIRIRAVKELFGYEMVYSHDVVEIERGPFPVYYEDRTELTDADLSRVRRMSGTVGFSGDFGEVQLCIGDVREDDFEDVYADTSGQNQAGPQIRCVNEGRGFYLAIDSELQRRGTEFEVGTKLTATGPVIRGFDEDNVPFDEHRIVITRLGQLDIED